MWSAPTLSAASSVQPPANTASRRSMPCSGAESRSKLQSMHARSVCWRGSDVLSPPVSRRNRSDRRVAIASTGSARTRAAASSSASGMPSSVWQISAIAAAFFSVTANAGCAATARSANRRTDSYCVSAATVIGRCFCGTASGGTRIGRLARHVQRLAARRQDLHLRARLQQRLGQLGAGVGEVLAVVEDRAAAAGPRRA